MIRLDERLREGGFRARPLLQVHDELLLEVPRDEVDRLVPVLRSTMESALAARRPADRRRQGRRRLGVDDAATADASRGGSEAPSRARACLPELPEVETVAPRSPAADRRGRDPPAPARPGPRTLRTARRGAPSTPAARAAGGVEAVGRRAKLLVIELSGDVALTIHLKMTGQLFVVPAGSAEDAYVRLVLAFADGRELRFRDIRKFGRVGLYGRDPATGELVTERRRHRRVRRPRARAARSGLHRGRLPAAPPRPQGAPEAAPPRPGVHRRDRQHLRRRGALGGPPPSAPLGRVPPAGRRAPAVPRDPLDPGRGDRAAGQLDRRLHRARRRRRDAGAPPGLPADRRALPALRPADPADRDRRPGDALLLVVPAPAGADRPGRPRSQRPRAGSGSAAAAFSRAGGGFRAGRRGAARPEAVSRADESRRRDPPGRRPARSAASRGRR